jgi:hypothetical protein
MNTGSGGNFRFGAPAGKYYLIADRLHYVTASYGSRRPGGLGRLIDVTATSDTFAELHLARKAILSGTVYDENGIGMPRVEVIAYGARLPIRIVGRDTTDDRGTFNIGGLDEGSYYVRSSAFEYGDRSGLLPNFSSDSPEPLGAIPYAVHYDQVTRSADITPHHGKLFSIRGTALCGPLPDTVVVKLISELGSRETSALCGFPYEFRGLAPANYDVYAEREADQLSGSLELVLERDMDRLNIPMFERTSVRISTNPRIAAQVEGRRWDPSGAGKWRPLSERELMSAGKWELRVTPPKGMYVTRIDDGTSKRKEDLYLVRIQRDDSRITIFFDKAEGAIGGTITKGRVPIDGAPVFLWSAGAEVARFYTAADGKYKFDGLAPGDYTVMSTFDCIDSTQSLIDEYNQPPIRIQSVEPHIYDTGVWDAP